MLLNRHQHHPEDACYHVVATAAGPTTLTNSPSRPQYCSAKSLPSAPEPQLESKWRPFSLKSIGIAFRVCCVSAPTSAACSLPLVEILDLDPGSGRLSNWLDHCRADYVQHSNSTARAEKSAQSATTTLSQALVAELPSSSCCLLPGCALLCFQIACRTACLSLF